MIPTYEEILKNQRIENRRKLASVRNKQQLIELVKEYAQKFAPNETDGSNYHDRRTSLSVNTWNLEWNLHLGEKDKIQDIYFIIDEMIRDPRLTMTRPLPKPSKDYDHSWFNCRFEEAQSDGRDPESLEVTIFFGNIESCQQVVVGEYTEKITKYVCVGLSDE